MQYASLTVIDLDGEYELRTGDEECIVLPLAGSCSVTCGGETLALQGRVDVFSRVTDFAYVGMRSQAMLEGHGRIALPTAVCSRSLPFRYGPADEVPVELRGGGPVSRQVNNFCSVTAFETDRLIACELITPGGCWSSYPPHKHDEFRPGIETELEEIYYYEIANQGFGFQRAYGAVDVMQEVRSGDRIDIPAGWHGPAMAAPGYDMYYLNVMAGPGPVRDWRFYEDPCHAHVQQSWAALPMNSRLPMSSHLGPASHDVDDLMRS